MTMPRSERSRAHYYVGTDGRITVWRRTLTKTYRSVVIREFGARQFRQAAASGPYSFPVEQVGPEEYEALRKARTERSGVTDDRQSWIDNADLPSGLTLPLPSPATAEEDAEFLRDLVAT